LGALLLLFGNPPSENESGYFSGYNFEQTKLCIYIYHIDESRCNILQKKIIALAVAGLMSGAAFAQSNVTVYGVADAGYARYSGSEAPVAANKRETRNNIDDSNQATSRIGFKGTEDMGGGLSALFQLEYTVANDANVGYGAARTQIVGLSSKTMGTMVMGRLVNPARALVAAQDPFGGNGAGAFQNIQAQTTWADNVIAYVSPAMMGFDVTVGYTNNLAGDEVNIAKNALDTNLSGWVFVPKYANGPIEAGFSYERFNTDGTTAANQDLNLRRWNLAGSYNFGVVKLGGTYGKLSVDDTTAVTGGTDIKQWMLSVTAPISASGTILASYNKLTASDVGPDGKASMWALGYNHAMSKRTNAYVTYAHLNTNDAAEGAFSVQANFNPLVAPTTNGYTSGLNIGLRHNF
jgi:predicted porin